MAFLVYFAILLVSIAGILLELDWLTKPKLDAKSPVQTATTVLPVAPPARPEVKDAKAELNPPSPKKPDVARVTELPSPLPPAETTGRAPASAPAAEQGDTSDNADALRVTPARAPTADAPSPARTATVAPQDARAPPSKCNVQVCAAVYASFRAADCTYQPFEGPRRICEKPSAGRGDQTARKRSKVDDLRDASTARRLRPAAEVRDDVDDDDDADDGRGGRRVIVIERPAYRSW